MGGSNASAADVKQSLEGAISAGEEPLHRSKTCWLQLKYAVDDEGTLKLFTHSSGKSSISWSCIACVLPVCIYLSKMGQNKLESKKACLLSAGHYLRQTSNADIWIPGTFHAPHLDINAASFWCKETFWGNTCCLVAGSVSNPYHGDGARAVQVLLKQAARVVQQRKEADDRACQAAALVSKRDDVIESFTQEHRTLVQLAEQFESTAVKVQQRRAIAGIAALSASHLSGLQYRINCYVWLMCNQELSLWLQLSTLQPQYFQEHGLIVLFFRIYGSES